MNERINYPIPGVVYQHYKGGLYEVLHLAKSATDDSIVVVYKSLHFGPYYTRPIDEWSEKITPISPYVQNQRFQPVEL